MSKHASKPPTDEDRRILIEMRKKPIGTPRTMQEKIAFEREWDERVIESDGGA